jgi:uncharacterized membrane protein YoaK (UPF0700 family)
MKLVLDETQVKWGSAVFLALVVGYLDGYGLLVLGTYVSFMSGNTTLTGIRKRTRQSPCRVAFRNSRPVLRHR